MDKVKPTLAKRYDGQHLPGWMASEKLDGVRAIWDGPRGEFYTRTGKKLHAPQRFTRDMPADIILDGELWLGRGKFQETVSKVRRHADNWTDVKFMIFDLVEPWKFISRYNMLNAIAPALPEHCEIVEHWFMNWLDSPQAHADFFIDQGGEGLMLRNSKAPYEYKRTGNLLKVKRQYSTEGFVSGYQQGVGKHEGRMGAMWVLWNGNDKDQDPIEFKIGTGFSDAQRDWDNVPLLGNVVTFKYFELTNAGVPRFASYVGERNYE